MAFINWISLEALGFIGEVVLSIINSVVGAFVTFGGQLVNFAFQINTQMLGGAEAINANNRLVEVGWKISRDLANLGFVLIIIIIALATILRFREYGAKKLLPKLIAAALIVNFSLAIGGAIISFSDNITDFFINSQLQSSEAIGQNITGAFAPQKFFSSSIPSGDESPSPGEAQSTFAAIINSMVSVVFVIAFSLIAFITLLSLAIMLFIRFVFISFLLILAPMAWLFWVAPRFEHLFTKWWQNFLKWTFFAPAVSFFIYLALVSVDKLANTESETITTFAGAGSTQTILSQGAQMFLVAGILLGGLIMANEMGIKGAGVGMGMAKGLSDKVKGFAQNRTRRLKDRALTAGSGRNKKGDSWGEQLGKNYGDKAIIGRMFTGIAGASTKAKKSLQEESKNFDEEFKDRTKEDTVNIANRQMATSSPDKRAALGIQAAKKGGWNDLDQKHKDRAIDAAKKTGREKDLMAVAPETAKEFGKSIEESMSKLEDVTKLDKTTLNNAEVSVNATFPQTDKLGKEGSASQKETFVNTLISAEGISEADYKEIKKIEKEIDKTKDKIKDASNRGDEAAVKRWQSQRDTFKKTLKKTKDSLSDNAEKAYKKLEHMHKKEYWEDEINNKTK